MSATSIPERIHPYGSQPRYACVRCGRYSTADRMVWSRHTHTRYCADYDACTKRARRRA